MAANHNVVSGERIEDVGPVRVMLESRITLDDVGCTLSRFLLATTLPLKNGLMARERWKGDGGGTSALV